MPRSRNSRAAGAWAASVPPAIEGNLQSAGLRVALVVARTNSFITERMLDGALDALRRTGCEPANVQTVRVPGALEIAPVARRLADSGRYDAIVGIGLVLRGATPHFDFISAESIRALSRVSLRAAGRNIAVTVGVLTCNTLEQAIERAGLKSGNKGYEAALAAIELVGVLRELPSARHKVSAAHAAQQRTPDPLASARVPAPAKRNGHATTPHTSPSKKREPRLGKLEITRQRRT